MPPATGNATTKLLPREPWMEKTRSGRFLDFLEAYGSMPRALFLPRFKQPFLTTPFSTEPSSWESAVVLRLPDDGRSRVTFGREPDNDLRIYHGSVSKKHGYFSLEGSRWAITDLGSANGTLLDGVRLPPNMPTRIAREVERIDMGDVVLTFMTPIAMIELLENIKKAGV